MVDKKFEELLTISSDKLVQCGDCCSLSVNNSNVIE